MPSYNTRGKRVAVQMSHEPALGRNLTLQPISVPSTSLVMSSWYLSPDYTPTWTWLQTGKCAEGMILGLSS